jgi:predicted transcriptional regulator
MSNPLDRQSVEMIRGGRPIVADLSATEFEFLSKMGPKFDLFYNRLSSEEKKEISERAQENELSFFHDYPVAPPTRKNNLDMEGFKLQKHAATLAQEAMTALQGLESNTERGRMKTHQMLTDIIAVASNIGTEGTLKRVYAIQPKMASALKYNPDIPIISNQMAEDFKAVRKNYSNNSIFSQDNGFSRYKYNTYNRNRPRSSYYPSSGVYRNNADSNSAYSRGYTARGNDNGSFFPDGGEGNRRALSPQGPTSQLPKGRTTEADSEEPREEEGSISGAVAPGAPLDVLSEGGEVEEVPLEMADYWGTISGLIWYYALLYGQAKSFGFLGKEQEVQRVSGKPPNAEGIRSDVRGIDSPGDGSRDLLREAHLGKPFSSSSKGRWKTSAGNRHEESESVYETDQIQDGGHVDPQRINCQGRLCSNLRSEGSLQPCTGAPFDAGPPRGRVEGKVLQVRRNAIRAQRRTEGLLKDYEEGSDIYPRVMEFKSRNIFGRSYSSTSGPRPLKKSESRSCSIPAVAGVDSKPGKIPLGANETVQISGLVMGLAESFNTAYAGTQIKSFRIATGSEKSGSSERKGDNESVGESYWNFECKSSSIPNGKSGSGEIEPYENESGSQRRLGRQSPDDPGGDLGAHKMDGLSKEESAVDNYTPCSYAGDNNDGRSSVGLGSVTYNTQTIYTNNVDPGLISTIVQQNQQLSELCDRQLTQQGQLQQQLLQEHQIRECAEHDRTKTIAQTGVLLSQIQAINRQQQPFQPGRRCLQETNITTGTLESPHVGPVFEQTGAGGYTHGTSRVLPDTRQEGSLQYSHPVGQFGGSLQYKPVSSGKNVSTESAPIIDRRPKDGHSAESSTHSGRVKYDNGFPESSGDERGLLSKTEGPPLGPSTIEFPDECRHVFDCVKPPDASLLRSPSPEVSGDRIFRKRASVRMERRKRRFLSPPYSSYTEGTTTLRDRRVKPPGSNMPPRLEGPNVVSVTPYAFDQESEFGGGTQSVMRWSQNDKEVITFAAGGFMLTLNTVDKLTNPRLYAAISQQNYHVFRSLCDLLNNSPLPGKRGLCLAIALLTLRGRQPELIHAMLQGQYSVSTFKNYCFGWDKFANFLTDEEYITSCDTPERIINLYVDFTIWLQADDNEEVRTSQVRIVKTAVSMLLKLAFGVKVADDVRAKVLARTWNRNHPQTARYIEMWDAGTLLEYYRQNPRKEITDSSQDYYEAVDRAVALTAFFTLMRPNEMASIRRDKNFKKMEDGFLAYITVKSYQDMKVPVFIPKTEDVNISPYAHIEALDRLNNNIALFSQKGDGAPLSTYAIRQSLNRTLRLIGVGDKYTAYSFKHAAMSFLVRNNTPREAINEAARYNLRKNNDIVAKYYARSEAVKKIHSLLAQAASKTASSVRITEITDSSQDYYEAVDRAVALTAFFTLMRPNEMASIRRDKNFKKMEDGFLAYITVKSYQDMKVPVFIPKTEDVNISPYAHIEALDRLNNNVALFSQKGDGAPLSTYAIRQSLNRTLRLIGVGDKYTAYSFKHAAMSFLVRNNTPREAINEAARYNLRKNNDIVAKYYARSEAVKKIHLLLAQAALKTASSVRITEITGTEEEENVRNEVTRLESELGKVVSEEVKPSAVMVRLEQEGEKGNDDEAAFEQIDSNLPIVEDKVLADTSTELTLNAGPMWSTDGSQAGSPNQYDKDGLLVDTYLFN